MGILVKVVTLNVHSVYTLDNKAINESNLRYIPDQRAQEKETNKIRFRETVSCFLCNKTRLRPRLFKIQ